jgi:hypothetical protein
MDPAQVPRVEVIADFDRTTVYAFDSTDLLILTG